MAWLCYANTLVNDFAFDDLPIIVKNPLLLPTEPWWKLWTIDYWAVTYLGGPDAPPPGRDLLYRPLTLATFRLNYSLAGLNPWSYHLTDMMLHAVVSGLVVGLGRRLRLPPTGAFLAGLVFAVMPIHAEAVANVVGRAEVLAALFTMAALVLCLGPAAEPRRHSSHPWLIAVARSVLISFCCAGAFLSKEVGVAAYPLTMLFAWNRRPMPRPWLWRAMLLVALGVTGALCLALRYRALEDQWVQYVVGSDIVNPLYDALPVQKFWTAWKLLGMHVGKTFFPRTLCMDYSFKAVTLANGPWEGYVMLGMASILTLGVIFVWGWRNNRAYLLITLGMLLTYFPVSNAVFPLKTFYAERIWYSPSLFVGLLLGPALYYLWAWLESTHGGCGELNDARSSSLKRLSVLVVTGITLAALLRCWFRNAEWHDNGTLFAAGVRDHPTGCHALQCYGNWLALTGRLAEAVDYYEQAVAIHPGHTEAHKDLGLICLKLGNGQQAVEHLTIALMQHPVRLAGLQSDLREASELLAASQGDRLRELERLYRDNPSNIESLRAWINALAESGRVEDARGILAEVKSDFPNSSIFDYVAAVVMTLSGRQDEAIDHYRRSLALDPAQSVAAAELAMVLLERRAAGDVDEARRWSDHALAVDPQGIAANLARAELLAALGQIDEAVAVYGRVIDGTDKDDPRRPQWELRRRILRGPE